MEEVVVGDGDLLALGSVAQLDLHRLAAAMYCLDEAGVDQRGPVGLQDGAGVGLLQDFLQGKLDEAFAVAGEPPFAIAWPVAAYAGGLVATGLAFAAVLALGEGFTVGAGLDVFSVAAARAIGADFASLFRASAAASRSCSSSCRLLRSRRTTASSFCQRASSSISFLSRTASRTR